MDITIAAIINLHHNTAMFYDMISNLITCNLEVLSFYCIYCGLLQKKMKFTRKNVITWMTIGCLAGITTTYVEPQYYKAIMYVSLYFILKKISQKETDKAYIVFFIISIISLCTQVVMFIFMLRLILIRRLVHIIVALGSLFIILFLTKKFRLYKIYDLADKDLSMRVLFFVLNAVGFSVLFVMNFDYKNLQPYIFVYVFFAFLGIYGYHITNTEIRYYSQEMPIKHHDTLGILTGLRLLINHSDDKRLVNKTKAYFDKLNIQLGIEKSDYQECDYIIREFVKEKELNQVKNKSIQLHLEVDFYEENALIPEPEVLSILSVLIDNAIEASFMDGEVYIRIYITHEKVLIEVENECIFAHIKEISKIQKGHSLKGKGRGFGLSGLIKTVEETYGGEFVISHKYSNTLNMRLLSCQVIIE